MICKKIEKKWQLTLGVVAICSIAFIYQLLSWDRRVANPKDTTMPSLVQIVVDGSSKILTPDVFDKIWLIEDLKATGGRFFVGMGIGFLLSFLLGISMGCWAVIEGLLKWPVTFFGQIPPTAMLAVYLVVANLTQAPVVPMMVCFGILPSLTLTIYNAVKVDVHEEQIYKAYTLGASNLEIVWNVIIPQILPRVIGAVRICIGPALVYLIAAEWTNEHVGFGYRLKIQGRQTHMDVVYNYLIILAVLGYLMNRVLFLLQRYLSPWFDRD